MIKTFKSQIGVRFFAILTLIILLSIVPFTFIALKGISQYGLKAAEVDELKIRDQTFSYLRAITKERAGRYQGFFDRVTASAGLLRRHASAIYADLSYYSESPLEAYRYHLQPQNGIWINNIEDPVVSAYWGTPELGSNIRRELRALTHIRPFLKQTLLENPEVLASHVITVSGIGQYYTDVQKSKESIFMLPPASEFDLRDGEPMTIFTRNEDTSPEVRWTTIYKDDAAGGLMLTASGSIYDNMGLFRGIVGIDVPLQNLINDILRSDDSGWADGTILFSFLLNRSSGVIAIPDPYYPLFGLMVDRSKLINSGDRLDIALTDSIKQEVRELAHNLEGKATSFSKIHHETDSYLVATHRMKKLGWILGVVVKEKDMLFSIEENRVALEKTIRSIKSKGIILSILTVCVAVITVLVAVRHLVLPLRSLIEATDRVAEGDLSIQCPVTTGDEVGSLTASFNSMVAQLRMAQNKQQKYSKSLESEIEHRTTELDLKRDELEDTLTLLKTEVERRQIISSTLKNSQQQYFDTLEASMAGIFIIDNGIFSYANTSFAEMVQYSQEDLVGLRPLDFIIDGDRQLVEGNARRRAKGEAVLPYTVKWIRKDGSIFDGEVWAMVNTWQNNPIMVVTVTDVTDIKRKERRIKVQDEELKKSLDEKEVLLKEIYHRTKNNMLVIIALLDLQTQGVKDAGVRAIFFETESRIRAMALIHEKLYQSQDLSNIDLGEYLYEVAESLIKNMVVGERIRLLSSSIDPVSITIDFAVPLGLVVNEIVTNAIKHGFPDSRQGSVCLGLANDRKGEIVLTVGDDGVGLPEEIDIHKETSFGMQIIIKSLVKLQLKGTVSVDRKHGTLYRITFPEPATEKRI